MLKRIGLKPSTFPGEPYLNMNTMSTVFHYSYGKFRDISSNWCCSYLFLYRVRVYLEVLIKRRSSVQACCFIMSLYTLLKLTGWPRNFLVIPPNIQHDLLICR